MYKIPPGVGVGEEVYSQLKAYLTLGSEYKSSIGIQVFIFIACPFLGSDGVAS